MNKIDRIALYLAVVGVVILLIVSAGQRNTLGGMTNYDSLTLQPETNAENALVVKNHAGTTQLTVYGSGGMTFSGTSTISGASTLSGAVTASGGLTSSGAFSATSDTRLRSPVSTGASSTLTKAATTSIPAATACDGGLVSWNPSVETVGTTTLPQANAMIADCLTTVGDEVSLIFRNLSTATTTQIIVASTTSDIIVGPGTADDLIAAGGWTEMKFQNIDGTNMLIIVNDLDDSD